MKLFPFRSLTTCGPATPGTSRLPARVCECSGGDRSLPVAELTLHYLRTVYNHWLRLHTTQAWFTTKRNARNASKMLVCYLTLACDAQAAFA